MARPQRVDYPDARHHVMNMSARGEPVFLNDEYCRLFLEILEELPRRFGVVIHGYSLLTDRFHLMLETPRANLSQAISYLLSNYTKRFNRSKQWDGPLFKGRFRSRLVMQGEHWQHLLAHVHLAPVKAGLCNSATGFIWSSHRCYVGAHVTPYWLNTESMTDGYGSRDNYERYVEDLLLGRVGEPEDFDQVLFKRGATYETIPETTRQKPKDDPMRVEAALTRLEAVTGANLDELKQVKRGRRGNAARIIAAYWLIYHAGLSNSETSRLLSMSPSSVSQALARVRLAKPGSEIDGYLNMLLESEYDDSLASTKSDGGSREYSSDAMTGTSF